MKRLIAITAALLLLAGCAGAGETAAPSTGLGVPELASQSAAPMDEPQAPEGTEPALPEDPNEPPVQTAPADTAPAETVPPETEPAETLPVETEPAEPVQDPSGKPMLFRVTGAGGQTLYLFGTIHAGDARNDAVLTALDPVLSGCDALAVEFDVVAFEADYNAQMQALTPFVYTDGTRVNDHMDPELYQRCVALLQEAGVYSPLLDLYTPGFWTQLAEQAVHSLTSPLGFEQGFDRRLIHRCYDLQIPVLDVESAELQYGMLAGFSRELCELLLEQILDSRDTYSADIDRLYSLWLAGDREGLEEVVFAEDDGDLSPEEQRLLEEYNAAMLDDRNLGMRSKAVEYLESGQTVFFAVGTAHLLGEKGLIQLLTQAGYTVERIGY